MLDTTTSIDSECQTILQRYADGDLDGPDARKQLAEALHRSNVAAMVAREKYLPSAQRLSDLVTEMQELVYTKVMQDTPGGFDLDLGLGASTVAWARQLLRTARNSMLRNITTRTVARMDLVDPVTLPDERAARYADMVFHTASSLDDPLPAKTAQTMQDAVDWLHSKTRHLRDSSRLEAHSATIRHAFSIPQLVRPRLAERKRLKALVDADPIQAHRSVKEMCALVEGEPTDGNVDQDLMALWDDYSFDSLQKMAQAEPRFAITLVDAVLSDRPRPSRIVLRNFRASVRAFGTGRGWARLADEVCEAFIALEFEAYSSFDTTASGYREERVAGRKIACLKSPDIFKRTLAHPSQKLGRNESAMYEQLDLLIRSLTDMEVKAPELDMKAAA